MATLYEITGQYLELLNLAEAEELDEQTIADTIEALGLQDSLEDKAEGYVQVMNQLDSDITAIKNEKKRLDTLRQSKQRVKDRLKTKLEEAMEVTGHEKIRTPLFNISLRNSEAVEVDENLLPQEYMVATYKPKPKPELKKLVKAGEEIPGVELVKRKSLSIR